MESVQIFALWVGAAAFCFSILLRCKGDEFSRMITDVLVDSEQQRLRDARFDAELIELLEQESGR